MLSAKHGFFLIEFYKKFIKKTKNKKKVIDFMCMVDDFSDSYIPKKRDVKAVRENLKLFINLEVIIKFLRSPFFYGRYFKGCGAI